MTVDELRREACSVMAAFKAQVESGISPSPVFMLHWPISINVRSALVTPGEWSRLTGDIAPLLNSGAAKQILFATVREIIRQSRADGAIFATDMWRSRLTPEGMKQEWRGEVDRGFERLVRKGWAVREEVIGITAQDSTSAILVSHPYRRRRQRIDWIGQLEIAEIPQAHFSGRQKMFGEFNDDTLGEAPAGSWAARQ